LDKVSPLKSEENVHATKSLGQNAQAKIIGEENSGSNSNDEPVSPNPSPNQGDYAQAKEKGAIEKESKTTKNIEKDFREFKTDQPFGITLSN
jgi:hypothetical protein